MSLRFVYSEVIHKSHATTQDEAKEDVRKRFGDSPDFKIDSVNEWGGKDKNEYWVVQWSTTEPDGKPAGNPTPHDDEREDAAEAIAEAAAEVAEETVEDAIETATELEEVVGELEEAIPDDTSPEVKLEILTALEQRVAAVETKVGMQIEAAEVAELAEDAAEVAPDLETTQDASEVAEVMAEEADAIEATPSEVVEVAAVIDEEPQPNHWYYRDLFRSRRSKVRS